jgi:hypothetical protein
VESFDIAVSLGSMRSGLVDGGPGLVTRPVPVPRAVARAAVGDSPLGWVWVSPVCRCQVATRTRNQVAVMPSCCRGSRNRRRSPVGDRQADMAVADLSGFGSFSLVATTPYCHPPSGGIPTTFVVSTWIASPGMSRWRCRTVHDPSCLVVGQDSDRQSGHATAPARDRTPVTTRLSSGVQSLSSARGVSVTRRS